MNKKESKTYSEQRYPGAAVDAADGDVVTKKLEKDYTCTLNNNPRNNDE